MDRSDSALPPHSPPQPAEATKPHGSIADTVISVIFALSVAFLFRAYVIEAFVIPTGSMAPTLLGAHYTARSPATGAVFAVDRRLTEHGRDATVRDPFSGQTLGVPTARLDGDRIFVRKRTPLSPPPERFDVVVFRSPTEPDERVIKRLVGTAGEQIALVDGDVFVRDAEWVAPGRTPTWQEPNWRIARKPDRVQREVWQPVFDQARVPLGEEGGFGPWIAEGAWSAGPGAYRFDGGSGGSLRWDETSWEIRDRYAYNDVDPRRDQRVGPGGARGGLPPYYPVSDLRVSFGLEPSDETAQAAVVLTARSHEFRATLERGAGGLWVVSADMRHEGSDAWSELGTVTVRIREGTVTPVEFWHADQQITVVVDRRVALRAGYDWSIARRLEAAIPGSSVVELTDFEDGFNRLSDPEQYQLPGLRIDAHGPVALHRVRVDRDLHYHPFHPQYRIRNDTPPLATHPITTVLLNEGQLFVLGDNSPASQDGRSWGAPDPWVSHALPITAAPGIVPEELLLGEAFMVYFPSLHRDRRVPVPDLGRVRLIR
jgi:signal peptidase I